MQCESWYFFHVQVYFLFVHEFLSWLFSEDEPREESPECCALPPLLSGLTTPACTRTDPGRGEANQLGSTVIFKLWDDTFFPEICALWSAGPCLLINLACMPFWRAMMFQTCQWAYIWNRNRVRWQLISLTGHVVTQMGFRVTSQA